MTLFGWLKKKPATVKPNAAISESITETAASDNLSDELRYRCFDKAEYQFDTALVHYCTLHKKKAALFI
ncbi:hypothetical protein [Enterococcus sp. LJL51]|uniref:hypothetical protein n=1 Tax=Enterococcus sp. LJL51 TaxID=3416656 RepID=UPI003CE9EDE9